MDVLLSGPAVTNPKLWSCGDVFEFSSKILAAPDNYVFILSASEFSKWQAERSVLPDPAVRFIGGTVEAASSLIGHLRSIPWACNPTVVITLATYCNSSAADGKRLRMGLFRVSNMNIVAALFTVPGDERQAEQRALNVLSGYLQCVMKIRRESRNN